MGINKGFLARWRAWRVAASYREARRQTEEHLQLTSLIEPLTAAVARTSPDGAVVPLAGAPHGLQRPSWLARRLLDLQPPATGRDLWVRTLAVYARFTMDQALDVATAIGAGDQPADWDWLCGSGLIEHAVDQLDTWQQWNGQSWRVPLSLAPALVLPAGAATRRRAGRAVQTAAALSAGGPITEQWDARLVADPEEALVSWCRQYRRGGRALYGGVGEWLARIDPLRLGLPATTQQRWTLILGEILTSPPTRLEPSRGRELVGEARSAGIRRSERPVAWARHQLACAEACFSSPRSPEWSQPNARLHYWRALQVFTLDAYPLKAARIWARYGDTYLVNGEGEWSNPAEGMACYAAALTVITLDAEPALYAHIHRQLADAYIELGGCREQNNVLARIHHLRLAARGYCAASATYELSSTLEREGDLWRWRLGGDRTTNLQRAAECYQAALAARPEQGASADVSLWRVIRDMPAAQRGPWAEVLAAYEALLQSRAEPDPELAARLVILAYVGARDDYLDRDNRVRNLQDAVACYEAGLRLIPPGYNEGWRAHVRRNYARTQASLVKALAHPRVGQSRPRPKLGRILRL